MSSSPLDCFLCSKELREPVALECSHNYCKTCIQGRTECPCCYRTIPADFPYEVDPLTMFLIETSHEAADSCANCDKISQPMFFCETCQQSLCASCKTQTHEARMFARHRVVAAEERARVRGRVACSIHSQPLVLYSTEKKQLVCIECFNGADSNAFVSLEHAHRTQLEKLEKWAAKLQTFQEERREEATVREGLIAEINEAFAAARNNVYAVCQEVVDTVYTVREKLTKKLEEERAKREDECRRQQAACGHALDGASYCLLATHVLCSAASIIDFLQLNGELTRRIQAQLESTLPRAPSACASEAAAPPRQELARSLEPVIGTVRPTVSWKKHEGSAGDSPYKGSGLSTVGKYQLMVDLHGAFGMLLARVERPLRDAGEEMNRLMRELQEKQRDLTLRKCLLKKEDLENTVLQLSGLKSRLSSLVTVQRNLHPEMADIWQEELDRVTRQQMIFRSKVDEASSLEDRAERALLFARQLVPFVESIRSVTAILDKKRSHPPDPAPMESICLQICTLSPDSELRVQAIEKEQLIRAAAQEAKKKEEDVLKAHAVTALKHAKRREHRRSTGSSRLVDVRRERSPGGTDVALLNPFYRHTISMTNEEAEAEFDGVIARRNTVLNIENDVVAADPTTEARAAASLSVSTVASRESARERLEETASRRQSVLSSLNRAIEDYGNNGDEAANLKASEVRRAERLRAHTGDSSRAPPEDAPAGRGLGAVQGRLSSHSICLPPSLPKERPLSAPVVDSFPENLGDLRDRRTPTRTPVPSLRAISHERLPTPDKTTVPKATVTPPLTVPAVPYVPQTVFSAGKERAVGAFEARERVLESLRQRVSEMGREEEEEEGEKAESVRL